MLTKPDPGSSLAYAPGDEKDLSVEQQGRVAIGKNSWPSIRPANRLCVYSLAHRSSLPGPLLRLNSRSR
jgi:hypothetical protein